MGPKTAAMAPTQQRASQRSRIERSLSLTIEAKDVRTRMQYGAQLDAMFPKLPRELSFEAFKEQMQRFGFVDHKELSDTFKRFASYSGKMQFRDFAYSLLPADKRPTGNVQPATIGEERRPHEAETSHDVWDLGLGATNMSICSSVDLGATGRTAGRATQLKSRMKKRRAASAGFGRKITYITNPKILDMESTRSKLAPADNLFRTGASHQYETTNMMYSKHWGDEQSSTTRAKGGAQPALWKLATGIAEGQFMDHSACIHPAALRSSNHSTSPPVTSKTVETERCKEVRHVCFTVHGRHRENGRTDGRPPCGCFKSCAG